MDATEPVVLPEDRLWRADEVAYFLGVPLSTLYTWKWENRGPACRKVGKRLRYRAEDVRAWVETCESAGGGS